MLNFETCWTAVMARDTGADGRFFYGVKTTGVYCRPGCDSRLPRRENVAFFATRAEAEAAGLRPCKRCRPADFSAAARHVAAIERACAVLRASESGPCLDQLAAAAGISRFHFHRLFKEVTGTTPSRYARAYRLGLLAERLEAGEPVAQSIYGAGFGSSSRAYEAAPGGLGMTPAARRRGGAGETIRFVTLKTPLGWALIAATARGICMSALGDRPEALEGALRRRFPAATLAGADDALREWAERIVAYIARPERALDLPLDIRGTAFQARVWEALRKIPLGKTVSYAQIAAALGAPKAVRAVGGACAANDLAIVVPCHRVVRSDGGLAGYRWGRERKRVLLAREREAAADGPADGAGR